MHECRKDNIFRQRRLNDSAVGGGIAFRREYLARAYTTLVVLVVTLVTVVEYSDRFDYVILEH